MQSVQRQFGRLMRKGPSDNATISVLLKDYEDADRLLLKVIDDSKALREAWMSMVFSQLAAANEFVFLYEPIVGASDGHGQPMRATPEHQTTSTLRLRESFSELKKDMTAEIDEFDIQVIKPATEARDYIQPIRKTIKKREAKRVDYEKCCDKVQKLRRKPGRSAKEDAQLVKAEEEMSHLTEEFQIADTHLRETLPPLVSATLNLVPPLLEAHIVIQNRLLGITYTVMHNYCTENGFSSPAPPMEEVIATWSAAFNPVQREIEAMSFLRGSRTTLAPAAGDGHRRPSLSPAGLTNGGGRIPRTLRAPSPGRTPSRSPAASRERSPQPSPVASSSSFLVPTDFTTATRHFSGHSPVVSPSTRPNAEYFGHQTSLPSVAATYGSTAIAKKKPPPPPPPKKPSFVQEFVVALYDFAGQGEGDLSFREGEHIRIVKRTETDQDWWVGELHGVQGNFPANYCRQA